ncbi:MAG: SpoIIE family protein phosphatase [Deltaproteobacteria bacterium]|nr:SpoIIE family protein phosphatase [Deltaproteobacteria bacterium]
MAAFLVAISGPSKGKRYPLEGKCVLGRSFNSDIYIGDLNVSRRHAEIVKVNEGHSLEDLGSGNGTLVNDKQVERHPLVEQDVVRIGGSEFRYEPEPKERWAAEVMTVIADVLTPETGEIRFDPRTTAQLEEVARKQDDLTGVDDSRALKMLESMYAVADAIATELDLDRLLAKILEHLFEVFPQAERGFVLLVDPESGQFVPKAVKQRSDSMTEGPEGLVYSQTIVDQVFTQKQGVIRSSPARPARLGAPGLTPSGDSGPPAKIPKMGAPLICRGDSLGTLHLEGKPGGKGFGTGDLDLLSGIARQAALAIANARAGQALIQHERLEADLRMARRIQESFLPRHFPKVKNLEFDTFYSAASHVGGDFYDIIELSPSKLGLLVGDISGHGVAAALMMARLTSTIRLYFQSNQPDPAAVLTHANQELLETEQDAIFATVLFMLLDLEQRTFTIANAGHQPPLVCSSRFSGISELDESTAVALGVVPGMIYPQEVYQLVPGDVVLLYTDGINEAENAQQDEYGMRRLKQMLSTVVRAGAPTSSRVVRRVIADVRRFVGPTTQSDDQTLLAFGLCRSESMDDLDSTVQ